MKKQISYIALAIAFSISPQLVYAQTRSHLTDEELQKLMPDFQRQVEYWNQYEEPERQSEAKAFAENWSRRDPTVAPFLGKWAAIEETMDIYPSTTEGQVCIISAFSTPNPEVELSLGKVLNQRIYTDAGKVILQEGNYVGIAEKYEIKTSIYVYHLIAPAEVPSNSSLSAWRGSDRVIEQFHAASCIAEASNEALEQRQIDASAVSARIFTREPGSSVTLRTGFILPPQARSKETGQPCEIALSNAKNRIEQGRDITVTIDIKDSSEEYPDHPDGRPTIIVLIVEGSASDSVMESPVFQKAIASEIINSCNSVGAVTFGRKRKIGNVYSL